MADIVIIGAGPVGLWNAIQIKKRCPNWEVQMYEKYEAYQRSHVLRLDHWSLLLYGKNNQNEYEKKFYEEVTGLGLFEIAAKAASSLYIKTHDLEASLKNYAQNLGIKITLKNITSTDEAMQLHPECNQFIASDGAHSKMRIDLLGENDKDTEDLQNIVEVKYQIKGSTQTLGNIGEQFNHNQNFNHMAFEYVGREKEGMTSITLRFFIDKATYEALPEAQFKSPIKLGINDDTLPQCLIEDINQYFSIRKAQFNDEVVENSKSLTKLTLSVYTAKEFAIKKNKKAWFLVGDAAMGVPYFRALNCGLILASRLSQIICTKESLDKKVGLYNFHRKLHVATEFNIAKSKNALLIGYDWLRKFMPNMKKNTIVSQSNQDQDLISRYNQQRVWGCENNSNNEVIDSPSQANKKLKM